MAGTRDDNPTTAGPIAFKCCVFRDHLAIIFIHGKGGVYLHVHTRPYLANGWEDCVQIWCVARDPLDDKLAQVI